MQILKPELSPKFFVAHIGLFVSITRVDFSEDSDIDFIVDFTNPIAIEFIDLGNYLEKKLHTKVDLVSKNGI